MEITRRGAPVARVMCAPGSPTEDFDPEAFLASTTRQPMHASSDAAVLVAELRAGARY